MKRIKKLFSWDNVPLAGLPLGWWLVFGSVLSIAVIVKIIQTYIDYYK